MKRMLIGVLIMGTLLGACSKPEPPQLIGISEVEVVSFGLPESIIGMEVSLYNPNNQRMQLKKANMEIFINNQLLGSSLLDSTIDIPKKDTFAVPLRVKVKTLSGASKFLQSMSPDTSIFFKVKGSAELGKAGLFFTYPLNYEGIQELKF